MLVNEDIFQEADCGVGSSQCGLSTDSMSFKKCACDGLDEFSAFETQLQSVAVSKSLHVGPKKRRCFCQDDDEECNLAGSKFAFGIQVVISYGTCIDDETAIVSDHTGVQDIEQRQCPSRPRPSLTSNNDQNRVKGSDNNRSLQKTKNKVIDTLIKPPTSENPSRSSCPQLTLQGTHEVYNFFEVEIEKLGTSNIVISAPATSVVVINLVYTWKNELDQASVYVQDSIDGIRLVGGIRAESIIWNVPFDYKFHVPKRFAPFNFYGTWLGRRGYVLVEVGLHVTNTWTGQLFANRIDAEFVDFQCGTFVGFSTCDLFVSQEPSSAPSVRPLGMHKNKNLSFSNVVRPKSDERVGLRCPQDRV